MTEASQTKRFYSIDLLRGFAVLLMIIYHFFYDYGYFGYWNINQNQELEWIIFRYIIVSLFIFTVGISINLQHDKKISIDSIIKRVTMLGAASILISIVTFFQFPNSWIYFGVIHFILIASLLGLAFRRFPNSALILGILILIGSAQGYLTMSWLYQVVQPIFHLPKYTQDLIPFFPWFGVVLIGMYFSYHRFHDMRPSKLEKSLQSSQNKCIISLIFMGRHALVIYLIHQPILFAGFLGVELIF